MLTHTGTPEAVLAKLSRDIVGLPHTAEIRQRVINLGGEPVGNSRAEFALVLKTEAEKWGRLVRDSGARAE